MATAMTITEKILALHAEKDSVSPGELIEVKVDLALAAASAVLGRIGSPNDL
jgi:homoaconitase/3-isopropylmalate dehydratase large subunit